MLAVSAEDVFRFSLQAFNTVAQGVFVTRLAVFCMEQFIPPTLVDGVICTDDCANCEERAKHLIASIAYDIHEYDQTKNTQFDQQALHNTEQFAKVMRALEACHRHNNTKQA